MNNLANSYGRLGRHEEALAMSEKSFEFFRRNLLLKDHPYLGEGRLVTWYGMHCCMLHVIFCVINR